VANPIEKAAIKSPVTNKITSIPRKIVIILYITLLKKLSLRVSFFFITPFVLITFDNKEID
jgi:hypothetical protein